MTADCQICIKRHEYNLCKTLKQNIGTAIYTKNQKCDTCSLKEKKCQCVTKKYCSLCSVKKRNYIDRKDWLPKCINHGNYFALFIYLFLLIYNFKILC